MAALTHVCMWTEKGWKKITAEEASKLHPGGTVSAKSGLFMCELCDQYVILVDGDIRIPYFKHNPGEEEKNCPERLNEPIHPPKDDSRKHELPIRIVGVSPSSFRFELGLVRVPLSLLSDDLRIEISPEGTQEKPFLYSSERINSDCITYLAIGEKPYSKYMLNFPKGNNGLNKFWPKEINGIDPDGTLFNKNSGKKLARGAEVEVNREYYLLKRFKGNPEKIKHDKSIHLQQICIKSWGKEVWVLYLVSTSVFNQESAKFYCNYHCRLTEHPVSFNPIWPLFVEGDCLVKYSHNPIYLSVEGQCEKLATFPLATKNDLASTEQSKIYEVICGSRQQLISTRRNQKVLDYAYFWREPLDQVGFTPKISVKDLEGNEVSPGETNILPKKNALQIQSNFDGEIHVIRDERIISKHQLNAKAPLLLDDLSYDVTIQVLIGLDIVWRSSFKKTKKLHKIDEKKLLKQVVNATGPFITAPHSLRKIMKDLDHYPLICQWIRKCLKHGVIKEQSYRRLQIIDRNLHLNR